MKIRIASLKEGTNRWTDEFEAEALELKATAYPHGLAADYVVEKGPGRIAVAVHTRAVGVFTCDRCAEVFEREFAGDCSVVFILRDSPLPGEVSGDDLRSYQRGQEELDVTAEVRDALLLALPMKMLCRENCLGLCPRCGANLNYEKCRCGTGG